MPSILTLLGVVLLVLFLRYPARLVRNVYHARRMGIPYVVIPFDQNSFLWMILSVPSRPWIKRNLPTWLQDRINITIYGWEFHEHNKPFDKWAAPAGDAKTLAWVTAGPFEVNSHDSEFAIEVLKRPKDFPEPPFNELFVGRFGHNILTTNGEQWARQRKIIAPVINERLSKVVFSETIKQTKGLLDELLGSDTDSPAETYKLFDMMKKITIHVLSGAGMGQSVTWSNVEDKARDGFKMTYMEACKHVMDGMAGPIILPSWFLDKYPSWLPGHEYLHQLGHACREYAIHTKDMLKTERQRQTDNGEVQSNVVSQLIQASQSNRNGISLSEDEMVGNLFVFTAAGFDTTANTLSFSLAALSRHPEWQSWMFEEIDRILPNSDEEELDYQAIYPKATRVMAIMLETLRLYTPLVHIPKSTVSEQIVQTSKHTYHLPANTTLYINTCALHRDPAIWRDLNRSAHDIETISKRVPDEEIWRPTRWIIDGEHGEEALYQPPRGTFMPWSFGPRNCPGMKMAQVEFTAAFLTLFRHHRIEAVPLQVENHGNPGLGLRDETAMEIFERIGERIADSMSIVTLQMNGVYDSDKVGNAGKGIKMRISKR